MTDSLSIPNITQALWFLPFCLPLGLWVAYSDLKYMKIPNRAVIAMAIIYAIVGWPALGLNLWAWGFAIMAITLIAGFLGNIIGLWGAGDAKFAAAMAGVFAGGAWGHIALLYIAASLAALIGQRLIRRIPAVRRAAPDWISWTSGKFPMGVALALMLNLYLLAAFLPQG